MDEHHPSKGAHPSTAQPSSYYIHSASLCIQTLPAAPFPGKSNNVPAKSSLREFWRLIISLAYLYIKTYLICINIKPETRVGLLPRTISALGS